MRYSRAMMVRAAGAVALGCAVLGASSVAGAAKINLKFAGRYVQGAHQKGWEAFDKAIKQYEKEHPNINIDYVGVADHVAYREKLLTMAAAGQLPDVINLYQPWVYDYAARGIIAPLTADVANRVSSKFYPAAVRAMTSRGRLYGFATENQVTGLMYSKKILSEAGIGSVPGTWSGLMALASKLTAKNANGTIMRQGFGFEVTSWSLPGIFQAMLGAYGGKFSDKDGNPIFGGKEGLRLVSDLKDWLQVSRIASAGPSDVFNDKMAFAIAFPWYLISGGPKFKGKLDQSVGVTDMPAGPGGRASFHYTWGFGISATSKHKAEATAFAEWISTSPQVNGSTYVGAAMAGLGSLPSVKADAGKGDFTINPGWFEGFLPNLDYAVATSHLPVQELVELGLYEEIAPALTGKRTPENALDNAQRKVKEILKRYKK